MLKKIKIKKRLTKAIRIVNKLNKAICYSLFLYIYIFLLECTLVGLDGGFSGTCTNFVNLCSTGYIQILIFFVIHAFYCRICFYFYLIYFFFLICRALMSWLAFFWYFICFFFV